ncbi:dynein axonemal heavy chain 1-like [Petromyzon marinus]|uniref:dynein axonemal heavy chain 1-like n=1 Tax=Petromyzon marinus TaxID=7757 RepID=UPI003F722DFA
MASSAETVRELGALEEEILRRLSGSRGNPVDDVELIAALHASKGKAAQMQAKVVRAAATELELDRARARYLAVAQRGQLLFFCTTALATVESMYQYSLAWYLGIFTSAITSAPQADSVELRVGAMVSHLTLALYRCVCRGLFEGHRLLFSFLVCSRILATEGEDGVDPDEWRFLLSGGAVPTPVLPNPAPLWLPERAWGEIQALSVSLSQCLSQSLSLCLSLSQCLSQCLSDEWRFLLSGGAVPTPVLPNPAPLWLPERAWGEIQALSALRRFSSLAADFGANAGHFQAVFESPEPQRYRSDIHRER